MRRASTLLGAMLAAACAAQPPAERATPAAIPGPAPLANQDAARLEAALRVRAAREGDRRQPSPDLDLLSLDDLDLITMSDAALDAEIARLEALAARRR